MASESSINEIGSGTGNQHQSAQMGSGKIVKKPEKPTSVTTETDIPIPGLGEHINFQV